MELRHLRYFCAVADEMHVRRAAERLGIAQPALTHQIKMLEAELGVRLLERAGRGIALTAAGHVFHTQARAILERATRMADLTRRTAEGLLGQLRIGFPSSASYDIAFMALLKSFRDAWPGIDCHLEERHTEELIEALEREQLDVAFIRPPFPKEGPLRTELFSSEPLAVAVPRTHPFASRKTLRLTDLAQEPFVIVPRHYSFGLSDSVLAACREAGFTPRISQRAPQLSSAINFVAAGMGITVTPSCMRFQQPASIRYVPLAQPDLRAELGIACRRDNHAPTLQHFLAAALAARPLSRASAATRPPAGRRQQSGRRPPS